MALDRLFGQLIDIARALTTEPPPAPTPRPSAPPPPPSAAVPAVPAAPIEPEPEPESSSDESALAAALPNAEISEAELVGDPTPTLVDEPIVSVQMARLLAAQGHERRALAMYETLLARRRDDPTLAREFAELRERSRTSQSAAAARTDDDELAGEDEIVAVRASERDVLLSWQVGDARIARGKRLLPDAEELAVRLVLFHRGPGAAVRREERERVVERAGEWLVADVPRDAWMTASVGLRHGGRFVSLTHSAATRAP